MTQYKTEDGYTFDLQDDGSLTDGDMTFDSLEELKKHVDVYQWDKTNGNVSIELIGRCPVDSGQIMITDPCYINSQWEENDFQDIRIYEKSDNPGELLQFRVHFESYEDVIDPYNKTVNELIADGTFIKKENAIANDEFSYNGACNTTINKTYGEFGNGLAVASSTGWGDGHYPVYAKICQKTKRVMELKIIFMKEE
tara:strand:+ start:24 stop:614 length:591 start_codon:yes stop_codon:yes gene_type:complete